GSYKKWNPKVCSYTQLQLSVLQKHKKSSLCYPFSKSFYPALTVNFGPRTICSCHRDVKNLSFGWCAITALGNYDWAAGGHLVLLEFMLAIEFPPGYTILIPSAIITHSNLPISGSEKRFSFMQFAAAAIFRFTEHGMK
ncbi:hypothetical protein BDQ17DRAFT_1223074, partial [Cyathus striatus]